MQATCTNCNHLEVAHKIDGDTWKSCNVIGCECLVLI